VNTGDPRVERSLRDLLLVARRRTWMIVLITVVAAVAAAVLSLGQRSRYQATSQVLLGPLTVPASIAGSDVSQDPARRAETEAQLARFPVLVERVLRAAGSHVSTEAFLADSEVSAASDADLLSFSVTAGSAEAARTLASAYADEFTQYHEELNQAAFEQARLDLRRRIESLRSAGDAGSVAARQALIEREQDLRTLQALDRSSGYLSKGAGDATRVQPRPLRNTVVGLLIGLLTGLGMAFLADMLDTRVRSASTIAEDLRLPLLARIPESGRLRRRGARAAAGERLRSLLARLPSPAALPTSAARTAQSTAGPDRTNGGRLVTGARAVAVRKGEAARDRSVVAMLTAPHSPEAEAFRMLRTRLEVARGDSDLGLLVVTSAHKGEGKSTVVANLAVGFARSGRDVVAVDLDLRHPSLHRMFGIAEGFPGVTNVVRGEARIGDATVQVPIGGRSLVEPSSNRRRRRRDERHVGVLPAGILPVDPSELLDGDALAELLEELRSKSDVVLVDTPPLLLFDDATRIGGLADAVLLVSRLHVTRSTDLAEVDRILSSSPTPTVGFVAVGGAQRQDLQYSYYSGYRTWTEEARRST
jgi:Mrp family chromosome partitioning ATPase/capsular polysaccharide biosynthesis protein